MSFEKQAAKIQKMRGCAIRFRDFHLIGRWELGEFVELLKCLTVELLKCLTVELLMG